MSQYFYGKLNLKIQCTYQFSCIRVVNSGITLWLLNIWYTCGKITNVKFCFQQFEIRSLFKYTTRDLLETYLNYFRSWHYTQKGYMQHICSCCYYWRITLITLLRCFLECVFAIPILKCDFTMAIAQVRIPLSYAFTVHILCI